MVVRTNTPKVLEARRTILELILANHPQDCLNCIRNGACELQSLAEELIIRDNPFELRVRGYEKDTSTPSLFRDPDKCVLCRRCIEACSVVQSVNALGIEGRGNNAMVVPSMGKDLIDSPCVMCGQCIHACPVGAIGEIESIDKFLAAVADPETVVVTQIAPAVRVAIAEEIGMATGELPMDVFVNGLRQIGFDYVLHTNFTADLTIMEEGHELLKRVKEGGTLPMFTSCSPGWINFCETFYPDLLDHLFHLQITAADVRGAGENLLGRKDEHQPGQDFQCFHHALCSQEIRGHSPRDEGQWLQDVDIVLTTREIGRLFRQSGIDFSKLPPSNFDSWMRGLHRRSRYFRSLRRGYGSSLKNGL